MAACKPCTPWFIWLAVALFAQLVAGKCASPRRVYVDVGVNWANTLRLWEIIAAPEEAAQGRWEIYGWEANLFMYDFIDNATRYLNGAGSKPILPFPGTGSIFETVALAPTYGCAIPPSLPNTSRGIKRLARHVPKFRSKQERRKDQHWNPIVLALEGVYSCVVAKTVPPAVLMSFRPAREKATRAVVESRLAVAATCNAAAAARYELIPAAAGGPGWGIFHVAPLTPAVMMRGLSPFAHASARTIPVVAADFSAWLLQHFTQADYVVLKVDIEGGEFQLLPHLVASGAFALIDVIAWECHDTNGDCKALHERTRSASPTTKWLVEGEDYEDNLYL